MQQFMGGKDFDIDMRRKTRAGRSSHWEMMLGCNPSLNSNKLHIEDNSITAFETAKTSLCLSKETEIQINSKDIYQVQGF